MRRPPMPLAGPTLALVLPAAALAAEGMWLPRQLPELAAELRARGVETDPARWADLMGHPMNAVIQLPGCTASFVSPDGLVMTNHHCVDRALQHNSSEENNLVEKGFLAATRADELPAGPGSRVLVTEAVNDVTAEVLAAVPEGARGGERFRAVEAKTKDLVAECERDGGHRCDVVAFHGGLEYRLVRQLEIRDVRVVYAPAEAIGVFGGEVDNWMWPRHTGDFAFYRAYVGPDGKPAEPAPENVPYRPAHHLEVSSEGVGAGDFVMVVGYPGTTHRYRLASEAASRFHWYYPTRLEAFSEWRRILADATAGDPEAAIAYGSLIRSLDNATKNYRGMIDGFARADTLERKRRLERELEAWIAADPERSARHRATLRELEKLVALDLARRERQLFYEYLAGRSDLLRAARELYRLAQERQKPDLEREPGYQERDLDRIRERLTRLERTFVPAVDRVFWRHFILRYAEMPVDQHQPVFDAWFGIDGKTVDEAALDARLAAMYEATQLGELDARLAWMAEPPAAFEASDDPFIELAVRLYESDLVLEAEDKELQGRFDEVRPRYMQALIAFRASRGEPVYPDANSTLRVTWGRVEGYSPRDAVRMEPFTRVEGIVEKHTGEPPFDATGAQLAAIGERRFGRYLDPALGSLPVNFLSSVDTTGGNSGSPTLDREGRLVGLLFDGVWESIIADWDFVAESTRSIHVDIRYALWVMETLDGARHLLQEMGVAPQRPRG